MPITTRESLVEKVSELGLSTPPEFIPPRFKNDPLEYAHLAVTTVREVATGCPIQPLRGVAGVVLVVLDTVQAVKRNRRDFEIVANEAFDIVYVIITPYYDPKKKEWKSTTMSPNLEKELYRLLEKVFMIHEIAAKQPKRHWFLRALSNKQDTDAIKECQRALDNAKSVFQISSSLNLHDIVLQTLRKQEQILDVLTDFREEFRASQKQTSTTTSSERPTLGSATSSGGVTITTVAGNYTSDKSSSNVTNTNSHNTTTTTITDSYNDSSYRVGNGRRQNRRR